MKTFNSELEEYELQCEILLKKATRERAFVCRFLINPVTTYSTALGTRDWNPEGHTRTVHWEDKAINVKRFRAGRDMVSVWMTYQTWVVSLMLFLLIAKKVLGEDLTSFSSTRDGPCRPGASLHIDS